jgi:hypothetical protein
VQHVVWNRVRMEGIQHDDDFDTRLLRVERALLLDKQEVSLPGGEARLQLHFRRRLGSIVNGLGVGCAAEEACFR